MAILMSIKPEFSRLIFSREKQYELRKTPIRIKSDNLVVVYESAPTKAIVGSFEIRTIVKKTPKEIWITFYHEIGISQAEFFNYFHQKQWGYAIKIDNPKLFTKSLSLRELRERSDSWRPPQNFQYLNKNCEILSLLKEQIYTTQNLASYT